MIAIVLIILVIIGLLLLRGSQNNRQRQDSNCVIGLLELTGPAQDDDRKIAACMYYLMRLHGWYFDIVDTGGDPARTLSLVEQYYGRGYRVFLGFTRSSILAHVLPWFQEHQDAIGVSLLSTASSLNIEKNIIRMVASDSFLAFYVTLFARQFEQVVVLYEEGDLAPQDFIGELTSRRLQFRSIPIALPRDQQMILQTLSSLPPRTLVIPALVNIRDEYLALISQLPTIPFQLDVNNVRATFTPQQALQFSDRYFSIGESNDESQSLLDMKVALGNYYLPNTFDGYNVLRTACRYGQNVYTVVDHMLGHYGSLELNGNNDRLFATFLVSRFSNDNFVPYYLYAYDPILGRYESVITTS